MKVRSLILVCLLIPLAYTYCNGDYDGEGKWIVNGVVTCQDEYITVTGDVYVKGSLTLDNVVMEMKPPEEHGLKIEVTGTMDMNGAFISTKDGSFDIYYESGSSGTIKDSTIEYLYYGIEIKSDGIVIQDSYIGPSRTYGIMLNGVENVLLSGNWIHHASSDNIYIYNSYNNVITSNNLTDAGGTSLVSDNSHGNMIESNYIKENFYGVAFTGSEDDELVNNEILNSTDAAVIIEKSKNIKSSINKIKGNAFGLRAIEAEFSDTGSEIEDSDVYDLELYEDSIATLDGTEYDSSKTQISKSSKIQKPGAKLSGMDNLTLILALGVVGLAAVVVKKRRNHGK